MRFLKTNVRQRETSVFRETVAVEEPEALTGMSASKLDSLAATQRSEAAFTLVEMMVAIMMLGIIVISLYGGISYGFANITIARQNLRATQIALEKMEIMRMYSWEQVNSNGFVPATFTAPFFPTIGSDTNGGLTYYGTTVLTNVPGMPYAYSNDMRRVTVTLNWTNKTVPQSLEMTTYISQYGMQRYIY